MKNNKRLDLSLYLVTDRKVAGHLDITDLIQKAIKGGVTVIQLREKDLTTREFYQLGIKIKEVIPPDVPLLIDDRLDLALAIRADGLHLGQTDLPAVLARKYLGSQAIIGLSVENFAQLQEASRLPVDYLAISPVFSTPTKTDTGPAWGLEGLKSARILTDLPLVAIGGINEGNAASIVKAGADGVAVVSAICAAPDPEEAARKLKKTILEARKSHKLR
ncbi:MAG TPA: thiamine phosphate synthase [Candidatus Saccharicenans sp.]|jgi:thiamine-phosphate pyrophosphorylase|nr:thiamine phosphate synthase [Candidatus Saccharicenans sp.]HRD01566.1 thiamine phosphate synthase [Candidatus Saccharicenans sp.]